MLVDNEKLISLLAENSGMEYDEVEELLAELVAHIKKALENGGEYNIEGFGSFKEADGALIFEASESLRTEINYKYAGMEPIELSPATTTDEEVEDLEQNRVKGLMGASLDDIFDEEEEETDDDEIQEFDDDLIEEDRGDEGLEKEEAPETESTQETEQDDEAGVLEKETLIVIKDENEVIMENKKQTKQSSGQQKSMVPLFITLVIIAVGIWAYLLAHFGIFGTGKTNQKQTHKTEQVDKSSQSVVVGDDVSNQSQTKPLNEQKLPPSAIETPEEMPIYGLTGDVETKANDGYTIVLYSLTIESGAESARAELQAKGLRTLIKKIPSRQFGTLYRVSIGQFETEPDAKKAAGENKNLLPENYFITKIN